MQPKLLVPEARSKESAARAIKISKASTAQLTYYAEVPIAGGIKRIYIRPLDTFGSDVLHLRIQEHNVSSASHDLHDFLETVRIRKGQSKEDAIEKRINRIYAPRFKLFGLIRF